MNSRTEGTKAKEELRSYCPNIYTVQTGQIFPSKNGSLLKKKKEKRESERTDKSMALSKIDELSQVIMPIKVHNFFSVHANLDLRYSIFPF